MQNNTTKKPHTVPASYLKYWSLDGNTSKGRNSEIYVNDGFSCRKSRVSNLCIIKKYYSSTKPNETEEFFVLYEKQYCKLIDLMVKTGKLPDTESLITIFIIFIATLLTRNPIIKHEYLKDERIENVKILLKHYLGNVFNLKVSTSSRSEQLVKNSDIWGLIMLCNKFGSFITSDNPILIITTSNNQYDLFFLPISPYYTACIFRKSKYPHKAAYSYIDITKKDAENLNRLQASNALRENYSNIQFSDDEIIQFKSLNEKTKHRKNYINQSEFRYEPFTNIAGRYFEFLLDNDL